MKRILSGFLVFALLAGCGSQAMLNANNIRISKSIVNSVDAFLDGEIDARTAHDRIRKEGDSVDRNDKTDGTGTYALLLSSVAFTITVNLSAIDWGDGGDVEDILEQRNKIAGYAGLKKRKNV